MPQCPDASSPQSLSWKADLSIMVALASFRPCTSTLGVAAPSRPLFERAGREKLIRVVEASLAGLAKRVGHNFAHSPAAGILTSFTST